MKNLCKYNNNLVNIYRLTRYDSDIRLVLKAFYLQITTKSTHTHKNIKNLEQLKH